jgi:hypothetical protein
MSAELFVGMITMARLEFVEPFVNVSLEAICSFRAMCGLLFAGQALYRNLTSRDFYDNGQPLVFEYFLF